MELLSILIPTYNRKERLQGLLDSLIGLGANIPIVVVDNASEDGTKDMMVLYEKRNTNIYYFRNQNNLGHDGNFLRLIELGKSYSEYSLWLGDDDSVIDDFFLDIPIVLRMNRPDIVLLNSYSYISNAFKRIKYKIGGGKRKSLLNINRDIVIEDIRLLFFCYYDKMPFGTIVVNNSILDCEEAKKYRETFHLYSGAIWDALNKVFEEKQRINAYILKKNYIIWGKGQKTYHDKMKEVCYGMGRWYALLPKAVEDIAYLAYKSQVMNNMYGDSTHYMVQGFQSI